MKACRYRSTLSLASVLDSAGWSRLRSGRFNPRKREPVPTLQEVGRTSASDSSSSNNNNDNNDSNVSNNYFTIFKYSLLQSNIWETHAGSSQSFKTYLGYRSYDPWNISKIMVHRIVTTFRVHMNAISDWEEIKYRYLVSERERQGRWSVDSRNK
jgi:hypothetical protein